MTERASIVPNHSGLTCTEKTDFDSLLMAPRCVAHGEITMEESFHSVERVPTPQGKS